MNQQEAWSEIARQMAEPRERRGSDRLDDSVWMLWSSRPKRISRLTRDAMLRSLRWWDALPPRDPEIEIHEREINVLLALLIAEDEATMEFSEAFRRSYEPVMIASVMCDSELSDMFAEFGRSEGP